MRSRESYFLISQDDVDKIDSLVGALNLAITEILESADTLSGWINPSVYLIEPKTCRL